MHHNPDLSPNQVVGDESGIIKLSIFVGCYFYLLELAFANLKRSEERRVGKECRL